MHYFWLMIAILTETLGTSALQASQQFTRLWPSVGVVVCYAISFYLMGLTLKVMPVGIVYAIWSGLGIVCIAGIGYLNLLFLFFVASSFFLARISSNIFRD